MLLCRLKHQSYLILNLVFGFLILTVFIYAAIFSPTEANHPIPSFYNRYMTRLSPTTGLSCSFSAAVRGQFDLAKQWNPYGIRLFLFFFAQLILRIMAFMIRQKQLIPSGFLIPADVILSLTLFITCYGKLLLFWNYI